MLALAAILSRPAPAAAGGCVDPTTGQVINDIDPSSDPRCRVRSGGGARYGGRRSAAQRWQETLNEENAEAAAENRRIAAEHAEYLRREAAKLEQQRAAPVQAPAPQPAPPQVSQEEKEDTLRQGTAETPGKAGIVWVRIPGGTFMMGSEAGNWNEQPRHQVAVKTFRMAKTLVTNKQYQACVQAGACKAPKYVVEGFKGDDQPVIIVDWYQAKIFSEWVGGRLPSEAEWEYAARSAGKERKYPWGDEAPSCMLAVFDSGGNKGCGRNSTWPVCSKPKGNTKQGLCDMAGNVWEWVQDWDHKSYTGAPTVGSAWEDPSGYDRVFRGGAYVTEERSIGLTTRGSMSPNFLSDLLGFRPAKSEEPPGGSAGAQLAPEPPKPAEPDFSGTWSACSKKYGWPCPGNAGFLILSQDNGVWKSNIADYIVETSGRHLSMRQTRKVDGYWDYDVDLAEDGRTMTGTLHQVINKGWAADCLTQACDDTYDILFTKKN